MSAFLIFRSLRHRQGSHCGLFLCRVTCCPTNMSRHLRHGSLGGRTCGTQMIFETGLSTLDISSAKRAPNANNFVDMRLVLVFLATFLQSLFNLFNVQNLIGHSYGRSRQKGRTCICRRHAMTDFVYNVNTKSVSATPAIVMASRDKRVALVTGTRWQISCPM